MWTSACIYCGHDTSCPNYSTVSVSCTCGSPSGSHLTAKSRIGRVGGGLGFTLSAWVYRTPSGSAWDPLIDFGSGPTQDNVFCLLYTSPSPRDKRQSRMPSSA